MGLVEYDTDEQVAVITLNRPEKANAQNRDLLIELNECWNMAAHDDGVRVIVLQANGKHFSAGHDLGGQRPRNADGQSWTLADMYDSEAEYYFGYSMAWRNVPKPSIAAVQGKCVAAGLMLCWPCDLIIAAENAEFSDPTARMGLAGVEYMAHVWEFGPRKAKEILFRSTAVTAEEARHLGMVNKVVPVESLRAEALAWAKEIATLNPMMTRLLKRGINATVDTMGFSASLAHHFDIHELAHGIQQSMVAAGVVERPANMLEHMRKTNTDIAAQQTNERAS